MKWFKFYGQEYLSDPKMLTLNASERSCWITLLSYASVNDNENDNGMITFLSEQQLMIQAGIDIMSDEWKNTEGVLKKLQKLKMITFDDTNDNTKITVLNWQKRQETSLTGYERVKRYREKHQNDNEVDNTKITSDKIRRDKTRIDKKRIDKNKQGKSCDAGVAVSTPENHKSEIINNKLESSVEYFLKIPDEDIKEFSEKFNIYEKGIRKKGEEMYDWCKGKGKEKQYKDFKATLRNAIRKDFGERPPEDKEQQARIRATQESAGMVSPYAKKLGEKYKIKK